MKYVLICTPKAAIKWAKELEKLKQAFNVDVEPTTEIYMNLLDPNWTIEKCDNIFYFISYEPNKTT